MADTLTPPAWTFDKTGTPHAIEAELRRENFGGNKRALAIKNAAIEAIEGVTGNGVRVAMREAFSDVGYRYVQLTVTDVPLLLDEGETERQERGREMTR